MLYNIFLLLSYCNHRGLCFLMPYSCLASPVLPLCTGNHSCLLYTCESVSILLHTFIWFYSLCHLTLEHLHDTVIHKKYILGFFLFFFFLFFFHFWHKVPKTLEFFKRREQSIFCYVNEVTFRKTSENEGWLIAEPTRSLEGWKFQSYPAASGRERRGSGGWISHQWTIILLKSHLSIEALIKPERTHFSDLRN